QDEVLVGGGEDRLAERAFDGLRTRRGADVRDELLTRLEHLLALLTPGGRDAAEHLPERRHAVARLRREVGAAGERLALRRPEDGRRPSAAAVQRGDGVHVGRLEV